MSVGRGMTAESRGNLDRITNDYEEENTGYKRAITVKRVLTSILVGIVVALGWIYFSKSSGNESNTSPQPSTNSNLSTTTASINANASILPSAQPSVNASATDASPSVNSSILPSAQPSANASILPNAQPSTNSNLSTTTASTNANASILPSAQPSVNASATDASPSVNSSILPSAQPSTNSNLSTTTASINANASILPSAQPSVKALSSNIDESNVKGYYYVLKAMSLAANLNNNSSKEDVLKVWTDNKSTIQKCKSIKFAEESITELPYNALNEMSSLAELDISCNGLTSISDRIGDLKNLTGLNLSHNQLISIPDSICDLSNLTGLRLSDNQLTSIPDRIGDLKNLTGLGLSRNRLTSIPDRIGDLKNLAKLYLSNNRLESIPDRIGDLKNLTGLNLSHNQLISIPDRIGDLSNLTGLGLSDNQLTSIPDRIGDLKNLTGLGLSDNQLASIPDRIGDLKNLAELGLSDNQLTSIPDRIGDLSNLTGLDLSNNQLTSIPDRIGDLKNLTKLFLYNNKLTSIPDRIGDLKNLIGLDLSNNMLTSMPSTIRNLRNTLDLVDIRNNEDIARYGDSEVSFGIEQLVEIFGGKLRYTMRRVTPIPVEEAYEKLMRMPIYWNFNRLKQLRATPIPQIGMAMEEMMAIWMSLPKEDIDESNTNAMTGFIHDIYNPDEQYNRVWPMAREYLQLSKSLLGSVLKILSTKAETDKELVESHINNICEGLTYCNDRKLSELRLAYYTLTDKLDNQDETVDSLINNIISSEKEKVFNFTFIRNTNQNVHLINYWKYQLRDEVGFDFNVNTGCGTVDQDPFNGYPGNALDAFYSKFTPEHAIKELTIRINETENCTYMSELMGIIANDNELTSEEKESMLVGEFTGITREGIKYYLLKQGLIIQNQE